MPKALSSYELTLRDRSPHQTLANWLYGELRLAILERRLRAGSRLPASRDFSKQYGISRGTVVSVFERLQAEGYISCRVGSGTWVNPVDPVQPLSATNSKQPFYIHRIASGYARPKALAALTSPDGTRPFCMRDPAVAEFPAGLWARLAARRARGFRSWLQTEDDGRGYRPLRRAIADYLNLSRGVRCSSDQVMLVSGVQQALDLLARFLLKPAEPVWMEDPGYFGAMIAFAAAGANIIPVPVDADGISLVAGQKIYPRANGVYLTPGHQFPLGMTMSLERRLAVLRWASRAGAFVIEDDYDSEFRFEGRPVPAMQSLDCGSNVIFVGSFNKLLFPSLRIGYMVLPASLADYFVAFRSRLDFHNLHLDQAVLCDFIVDGHFGRHLRRMRDLYGNRLARLIEESNRYLGGLLHISGVRAGLYTAGLLRNGMSSREAEKAAVAKGVEVLALDRFTIQRLDPKGLLLGFAAFDESAIRAGVTKLADALESKCRNRT